MDTGLTEAEREVLDFLVDDGWPLIVLQDRLDIHAMALSLVRRGLAEVYGRPDRADAVPTAEAEAILLASESWEPVKGLQPWMIRATSAGSTLSASDS